MSQKQREFANLLRAEGYTFEEEVREFPGTPDIYFREKKLAVFFHGCFWHDHGCKNSISNPVTASQRAGRAITDREQQLALLNAGIKYVIVWECEYDEDPESQIAKVIDRLHLS